MIDLEYLGKLLKLLKDSNATSYKTGGIEITLDKGIPGVREPSLKVSSPLPAQSPIKLDPSPMIAPGALTSTNDEAMAYDEALHWSSSPSPLDQQLPLTGEE